MAHRLVWSLQAIEDIESIATYISRDSEMYAISVVQKLVDAPLQLSEFPDLGRIVPETQSPAIREIFVYSYRLMYEILEDEIHVLTIVHGKREFRKDMIQPDDPANPR